MSLANFIFPAECLSCQELLLKKQSFLCPHCLENLSPLKSIETEKESEWEKQYHLFQFKGTARELIHKFKYNQKEFIISYFSFYFKKKILKLLKKEEIDYIAYVPMDYLNQILRSYNQALVIAKAISKLISKPLIHPLKKKFLWKKQAFKSKKERLKKIPSLFFHSKKNWNFEGKSILLVDDVLTTGATLNSCTRILKKLKAEEIIVFTLAH